MQKKVKTSFVILVYELSDYMRGPICKICRGEKVSHHFSRFNNMDVVEQPKVPIFLTQVIEMIIAQVNPTLHVSHAHGG